MNNQAFSKIWIMIILVALIGGGVLVWQYSGIQNNDNEINEEVSEDETMNWKTYTNEESGYLFKYPQEWNAVTNKYNSKNSLFGPGTTIESGYGGVEYIDTLSLGQSLKNFVKEFNGRVELGSISETEAIINNQNVIISILPKASIEPTELKNVCFENAGEVFNIHLIYKTNFTKYPDDKQRLDIFNQMLSTFKFLEEPKKIGPAAVWDSEKYRPECIVKWHECENIDCISGVMEQYGASTDAKNFTKLFSEQRGYLMQFQEMGKIDLGIVAFPDRANTNEEYYLLNGFPLLVGTGIKEEEVIDEIKQDLLYSEIKEKYPNIWFLGLAPKFVEKKALPNNNERFIFTYRFVNGCRVCDTEYSAKIGFDFDSDRKFLKMIFLQIVKK